MQIKRKIDLTTTYLRTTPSRIDVINTMRTKTYRVYTNLQTYKGLRGHFFNQCLNHPNFVVFDNRMSRLSILKLYPELNCYQVYKRPDVIKISGILSYINERKKSKTSDGCQELVTRVRRSKFGHYDPVQEEYDGKETTSEKTEGKVRILVTLI